MQALAARIHGVPQVHAAGLAGRAALPPLVLWAALLLCGRGLDTVAARDLCYISCFRR